MFLALVSVGYATTNVASRFYIETSRMLLIIGVILVIAIIAFGRINRTQLISSILLVAMLLYAVFISFLSGSFAVGSINIVRDGLVVITGAFVFGMPRDLRIINSVANMYAVYVVIVLVVTVFVRGIDLGFLPRFSFEYSAGMLGSSIVYSQGISKFFGLGVLIGVYLVVDSTGKYTKLLWFFFSLICLFLSIIGGARGDALAAILVVVGFVTYKLKKKALPFFLILGGLAFAVVEYWDDLAEQFVFFQRFAMLGRGDYGMRDVLFSEALTLLSDEPVCLIRGCGLGYFQYYYNYDFGLYPHNVFLESIITFGVPTVLILCILAYKGLKIYVKNISTIDFFILFFAMGIIIDLKSGYVFGNWLTMSMMMYFAGIGISTLLKPHSPNRSALCIDHSNADRLS